MSERIGGGGVEQLIIDQREWLDEAIRVIAGPEATLAVLEPPTEVRDDATMLSLKPAQELELREIVARFGIGAEYDIPSSADFDIIEGGKPWKILAEAEMATGIKIFAGSPDRVIGADEIKFLSDRFGVSVSDLKGISEYEMAKLLASGQEGFTEKVVEDEGIGYEVSEGNKTIQAETGQLLRIGNVNGRPVYMLRVDREDYIDQDGNTKFKHRPDGVKLLGFISDWLAKKGDGSSSIGLNTSNTYASRALDVIIAGAENGRDYRVGMYGRDTLTGIAGDKVPAQTPIKQIPGELCAIKRKLDVLSTIVAG